MDTRGSHNLKTKSTARFDCNGFTSEASVFSLGGQSYMIPVDARSGTKMMFGARMGVSIDRLLSELKNSGAHIRLAVIDASRPQSLRETFFRELLPWPCVHRGR